MALKDWIRQLAGSVGDVLSPRRCAVCGNVLGGDEQHLCRRCLMELPRTGYHKVPFNAMEQLFAGKVPIERATAFFYYEKGSPYAAILHDMKYRHVPTMGRYLASLAAVELQASGFFDGVEVIVPVPLHITKLAQRGYNQSEYLAQGLRDATGLEVSQALVATREHATQTHKGAEARFQNTRDTFALDERRASALTGRHVLLVDDVVTTGATLQACAEVVHALPGTTISLFTLAAARLA